jgi:hypothetical protein
MLRDKIQRKQNRPRYGKKNSKENEYYIWYKNKTKSNEKRMKLKKNLKNNLKQWKTNQKKEDYNCKTKCIRGQLRFLADLAQISRSEKRKQVRQKLYTRKGKIVIMLSKSIVNYLNIHNETMISFRVFFL